MNAAWHEERRTGLGGSDMPAILGLCPFGGTPVSVWRQKVGLDRPNMQETPDMRRGNLLEPIIRDLYREETGHRVEHSEAILRHPIETWAIAHLDGTIFPADDDQGTPAPPGVLEIKAPRIRGFLALEENGVPAHYQAQAQHYMGVTGFQWADFTAWNAECFRLLIVPIKRDQGLIDLMFERGRDFWTRHVLTGIPPDGPAPTVLRLENLSPTVLRLDTPEWRDAAQEWVTARAIATEAKEFLDQCRERLLAIATRKSAAKVRGGGVALTVSKDGKIIIKGKEEIAA